MNSIQSVRNPRIDLLSDGLLQRLKSMGELKPLSFGKLKGFRICYLVNSDEQKNKIFDIFLSSAIQVMTYTEFRSPRTGYINIHEIAILGNSNASGYKTYY